MFISRVILRNWKNFTNVDVALDQRVFIVGPNAAGKSNFLDVFRFLRDVARSGGGLQEAVRLRGGLSKIRCLAARAPNTDVEIEVLLTEPGQSVPAWRYRLALTQKGGGVKEIKAVVREEKVWKAEQSILERPTDTDKTDEQLNEYTHLEQPTANSDFRELTDFFKAVDYQHIIPQLIREPSTFQRIGNNEDFYGRDLLEKLGKMPERQRKSQLNKIEQALTYAVPNLKNLKLEKDKMGVPHLQAIYEHWRPQGAKHNEEQFSDGTLRLIGLFFAMLNGVQPLLLEEPELSLNSGVVRNLAETIHIMQKRRNGKRQVILSTHSYDLLNNNGIRASEIIILRPVAEGTSVENAEKIKDVKSLLSTGISPAEAVLSMTEAPNIGHLNSPFVD